MFFNKSAAVPEDVLKQKYFSVLIVPHHLSGSNDQNSQEVRVYVFVSLELNIADNVLTY